MPRPSSTKKAHAQLSIDDARRIVIRAQGLALTADRPKTVAEVLRRTGAVQLDTISVLARSHELVAYARLGAIPRATVEAGYWAEPAVAFEYVAHANCIIPIEDYPWFAFRRDHLAARSWPSFANSPVLTEIRARLRDGPITTTEAGGARKTAGWWNWSEAKQAIELMCARGDVVCTMRRGWKRVYDLPERAIPADLLTRRPTVEESYAHLVKQAARALGVGTARDIANYYMLLTSYVGRGLERKRLFDEAMASSGLEQVEVEGWDDPAFAHADALKARAPRAFRTTLISPFDSLVWAEPRVGGGPLRARTLRLFGYDMLFEPYVPKEKRVHGYFTMPVLAGGRIVGHVDPAREGKTLVARNVDLHDPSAVEDMAIALREAAAWVGCDAVRVDRVQPRSVAAELKRALG
ncbi:MAG: YcaQ family DNA glycosylase [Chloroflexi bacterium]|nr:YcaQ family DNA glycosylase [Chloroflexota bacterium]